MVLIRSGLKVVTAKGGIDHIGYAQVPIVVKNDEEEGKEVGEEEKGEKEKKKKEKERN